MLAVLYTSIFLVACRGGANTTASSEVEETTLKVADLSAMSQAANAFLESLSEEQRKKAIFEFEDDERFNWHFIPKDDRVGARWEHFSEEQRALASKLLRTVLSEQGHNKATSIMQLELVLREIENRPDNDEYRHPEKYFISMYGDPAANEAWGWRFEGHHLSLSFSSVDQEVAVTPAFMGTNPAIVREGSAKGREVLKLEQDLGRALINALDAGQQKTAIIDEDAPDDIITMVAKRVELDGFEGIQATDMTKEQREQLLQLLMVYINNLEEKIAEKQFARVEESGLDNLYFAWAGGLEPGDRHYYRIHGPTLLIEYDNTQNDANHIHVVLRDPTNDFGEDLLKQHYEAKH